MKTKETQLSFRVVEQIKNIYAKLVASTWHMTGYQKPALHTPQPHPHFRIDDTAKGVLALSLHHASPRPSAVITVVF